MIPPLTRAVCHLSIACLLSPRPVRPVSASVRRHNSILQPSHELAFDSSKKKQVLTARHSHKSVNTMQTQAWQYPTPLSFPAKTKHTATVIILHGLGDTGRGWSEFGPMLQASMPYVKFVFPTAPTVSDRMLINGCFCLKFDLGGVTVIGLLCRDQSH